MLYSEIDGFNSSKIILGTDGYGAVADESTCFDLIDAFVACSGNHIDTAKLYTDGESERIIGRWIKARGRSNLLIATKGGHPNSKTMHINRLSKEEIESDINSSLKNLGIDCIDLYWLHRDSEDVDCTEIIENMNSFVKNGKIKKFACSNWKAERIEKANSYAKEHGLDAFVASQIRFSPASTAPGFIGDTTLVEMNAKEYEFYKKSDVAVMGFASQAKGFFSKYLAGGIEALSPKAKERYYSEDNVKKSEFIDVLSKKYGVAPAGIVCSALISLKDANVFPIIGGKSVKQLSESFEGADLILEKSEIKKLVDFV